MRDTKATPGKIVVMTVVGVLLTLVTAILGGPMLRVLRKSTGALVYWTIGLLIAVALFFVQAQLFTALVISVWVLVGLFTELEQKGVRWWFSGAAALVASSATGYISATMIMKNKGLELTSALRSVIENFIIEAKQINSAINVDADLIMGQVPSAIIGTLVIVLGLSLIYERKAFRWFGLANERLAGQIRLLEFRLPDFMIWIAMISFLFSFLQIGKPEVMTLAGNILNVTVILYFFQGLAVTEVFLQVMRAGVFMRVLTYFILIGQLLFLVSAVGVIDYWVDFRRRFRPVNTAKNH